MLESHYNILDIVHLLFTAYNIVSELFLTCKGKYTALQPLQV